MGVPPNTRTTKRPAYKLPMWFYVILFIVPFPIIHFSHWWGTVLYIAAVTLLIICIARMVRMPLNRDHDKNEHT